MTSCARPSLLQAIEGYLLETDTTAFAFGQAAVGDPGIVSRLRRGGQLQEATAHALLDHMIGHLEALLAERAAKADEEDMRAEYAAIMEECRHRGIDPINRTILMPVPLAIAYGRHPLFRVGGRA